MATGTYGTIRPADVSPTDVDIILNYTQSRDVTNDFQLTKLNSSAVLTPYFHNTNTGGNADIEILGGLYNLRLPANVFNQLGIYTLYIRPAEIRTTITDCGILASLPNIKGIVVDLNNVPVAYRDKFVNQGLIGYRVEYLQPNGAKIPNFFRIITSSFYCEPVVQNSTNTTTSIVRYQYVNGVTNLMFCTLSPSSSPSNKPNATPFIGQPDQDIIISNTFFNPVTMEIEIVEHDISTLAIALFGNQTKSLNDGIYTLYDTQNNIYKQYNLFEIRDQYNELLYEVREDRGDNIDFSKNFSNITQ